MTEDWARRWLWAQECANARLALEAQEAREQRASECGGERLELLCHGDGRRTIEDGAVEVWSFPEGNRGKIAEQDLFRRVLSAQFALAFFSSEKPS